MKTKAVRLYGKNDLRLEAFELPKIKDDEILAKVISDSICMSSYKAAQQGADHKRVPKDVATNPIIIGHEFCGELVEVGAKWAGQFKAGDKFAIQPAMNHPDNVYAAPGYSFPHIGGAATYIVIPAKVMERGCLLPYTGEAFYFGSLGEPMSCIVGGFNVNYHYVKPGSYEHAMGIVAGGNMALLAGVGPMGLGAIDFALHGPRQPRETPTDGKGHQHVQSVVDAHAAGGLPVQPDRLERQAPARVAQHDVHRCDGDDGQEEGDGAGAGSGDDGHPGGLGEGVRPAHGGAVGRLPGAKDQIVRQRHGDEIQSQPGKDLVHVTVRLQDAGQQAPQRSAGEARHDGERDHDAGGGGHGEGGPGGRHRAGHHLPLHPDVP